MEDAADKIEIFLQPGDVYFGEADTRIRTLLGSCVSVTAWHPRLRIGAMCHYMLGSRRSGRSERLDGRYADEAVLWFLREASARGTDPMEYEFKIFGGGDMFGSGAGGRPGVGEANVQHGLAMLERLGHRVVARHLGGSGHRTVIFDVGSGEVWMRHVPLARTLQKAKAA